MSALPSIDVWLGAADPEFFEVRIGAGQSGRNLTTATAASLLVRRNGIDETWALTIHSATTGVLTLRHVWAVTETAAVACFRAMVLITFADGVVRAGPIEIVIRGW